MKLIQKLKEQAQPNEYNRIKEEASSRTTFYGSSILVGIFMGLIHFFISPNVAQQINFFLNYTKFYFNEVFNSISNFFDK